MSSTAAPSTGITLQPYKRQYIPADFVLSDWDSLKPFADELQARQPTSVTELLRWMADVDELHMLTADEYSWRYIRMTCNTRDEAIGKAYEYMLVEIIPKLEPYGMAFAQKLVNSLFAAQLDAVDYDIPLKLARRTVELYREENVELKSQIELKAREYGNICGEMTVELDGQKLTMPQAGKWLEDSDRSRREQAWRAMAERRAQDSSQLDTLLDELLAMRQTLATNAGFASYTDYRFAELGRFGYTPADVAEFRQAIKTLVVPLVAELQQRRKNILGLDSLKPWDTDVNIEAQVQLQPFANGDELEAKSRQLFNHLSPELGLLFANLKAAGHLDLDSREGKAPGGYNISLYQPGIPFIFMNAAGTHRDMVTLVHEAGHAFHSMLTHELGLLAWKDYPSEVAELASMGMELLSMDHWDIFYPDADALRAARIRQVLSCISLLPWIALVDDFQQWLYAHPGHSAAQRSQAWLDLHAQYGGAVIDWTGLEAYRASAWQRQLHIYEVPFYYIEYGFAQLGALQLWQRYRQQPQQGMAGYLAALRMGYRRPIAQVFATAGVQFGGSPQQLAPVVKFVREALKELGVELG